MKLAAEERKSIRKSSQFRGVSATGDKWRVDLEKKNLGIFKTEEEAAAVYDQALLKRDGPQALTNAAFPTLLSDEALERRLELQALRKRQMSEGIDTTYDDDGTPLEKK